MQTLYLASDRLADAYDAVMTTSGTHKNDVDRYRIVRFRVFVDQGIVLEATDGISASQAWLPFKEAERPAGDGDHTISVIDANSRVGGLIRFASRTDEMVTIDLLEEEAALGMTRTVLDFHVDRERLKANTIGTATPILDKVFDGFVPGGIESFHLGGTGADRVAKIAKAVGPLDVTTSSDGTILVKPAKYCGFDFRAIMSVRPPTEA